MDKHGKASGNTPAEWLRDAVLPIGRDSVVASLAAAAEPQPKADNVEIAASEVEKKKKKHKDGGDDGEKGQKRQLDAVDGSPAPHPSLVLRKLRSKVRKLPNSRLKYRGRIREEREEKEKEERWC